MLPGRVVMCSQVDLSLCLLASTSHHLVTPRPACLIQCGPLDGREGCLSPGNTLSPWVPPLSVAYKRAGLNVRQGRQLSCHCASKEVDAWVNTQKQCQWEGRAHQSSPSLLRFQCPAPFTAENTALAPSPGQPLFLPVQLGPSTLPLAGRLRAPQPLPVSPSFTQEQLLKRGWLDSVSQLALELESVL